MNQGRIVQSTAENCFPRKYRPLESICDSSHSSSVVIILLHCDLASSPFLQHAPAKPAVLCATSLWPIMQAGASPNFIPDRKMDKCEIETCCYWFSIMNGVRNLKSRCEDVDDLFYHIEPGTEAHLLRMP